MSITLRIYGLLLFLVLGFTSCDDEPLPSDFELNVDTPIVGVDVEENALIGEWLLTDHEFTVLQEGSITVDNQTIPLSQTLEGMYVEGTVSLVFQENGDYISSGMATYSFTVTQEGLPTETEQIQESFLPESGTWSLNNGVLTLVDNNGETEATITSFDNQEMVLAQDEVLPGFDDLLEFDFSSIPGFEDLPDINFDFENTVDSEITFSKSE